MRCRTVRPKRELLRLVRLTSGEILADNSGRTHGRSAYVCADMACVEKALKSHLFERALGRPVAPEQAEALISMAQPAKAVGEAALGENQVSRTG